MKITPRLYSLRSVPAKPLALATLLGLAPPVVALSWPFLATVAGQLVALSYWLILLYAAWLALIVANAFVAFCLDAGSMGVRQTIREVTRK